MADESESSPPESTEPSLQNFATFLTSVAASAGAFSGGFVPSEEQYNDMCGTLRITLGFDIFSDYATFCDNLTRITSRVRPPPMESNTPTSTTPVYSPTQDEIIMQEIRDGGDRLAAAMAHTRQRMLDPDAAREDSDSETESAELEAELAELRRNTRQRMLDLDAAREDSDSETESDEDQIVLSPARSNYNDSSEGSGPSSISGSELSPIAVRTPPSDTLSTDVSSEDLSLEVECEKCFDGLETQFEKLKTHIQRKLHKYKKYQKTDKQTIITLQETLEAVLKTNEELIKTNKSVLESSDELSKKIENNYGKCKICLGEPATVLFMPCMHLGCCVDCFDRCDERKCPFCRERVRGTIDCIVA